MIDDGSDRGKDRLRDLEREFSLARERFEWVAESSSAAVFYSSADGMLTYVNRAAAEMLGYGEPANLVGQSAAVLYHDPKQRAMARELLGLAGAIDPMQMVMRRVDGGALPTMGRVRLLKDPDGQPAGIVGVFEDISHRSDLQGQVDYQAHLLGAIREVLDLPFQCATTAEIWAGSLTVAMNLTESRIGAIGEFQPDGKFKMWHAEWGDNQSPLSPSQLPTLDPKGLILWVREEGVSVITNKPTSHPMYIGPPDDHPQLDTFLGVPLRRGDEVVGMIGLANRTGGYLAEDRAGVEVLSAAVTRAVASGVGATTV
jgi:two-component system, NtrC family, sensor kinase